VIKAWHVGRAHAFQGLSVSPETLVGYRVISSADLDRDGRAVLLPLGPPYNREAAFPERSTDDEALHERRLEALEVICAEGRDRGDTIARTRAAFTDTTVAGRTSWHTDTRAAEDHYSKKCNAAPLVSPERQSRHRAAIQGN
jgi:hypothetical protein